MLRRKLESAIPLWAAEVLRLYSHYKETGALPDNRGLDYNNPWLIDAFDGLMEEEGRYYAELSKQMRGNINFGSGWEKRWRRSELPKAQENAVKEAQNLVNEVLKLMASNDFSS